MARVDTDARPRILFFNGSSFIEGDTKVALGVARALASVSRLQIVTVPGEAADAFAALPGASVCRSRGTGSKSRALSAFGLGLSTCLRRRPALIYTYDRTHAADVACVLARALQIPFVFHINNWVMFDRHPWRFRLARRARELWSVSEFVNRAAVAAIAGGNHVTLINSLLDEPARESQASARDALGIPQAQRAVVLVGRLSPFKGQETLVRAMADPRLAAGDIHAYVVGHDTGEGADDFPARPDFAAYLRGLANELGCGGRVHFIGWKPGGLAFRAADVACVLSDAEPFGLVIPESIAAGVPLVATASGAIPEMLQDRETALLVPPRQPLAVANALLELFDQPALGRQLAARAAERTLPRLAPERFAEEVRARVDALLRAGPDRLERIPQAK